VMSYTQDDKWGLRNGVRGCNASSRGKRRLLRLQNHIKCTNWVVERLWASRFNKLQVIWLESGMPGCPL